MRAESPRMRVARGAQPEQVQGVLNIVKDDADARREGSIGSGGCDRRAKWDLRHQSGRPRVAGSCDGGQSGLTFEGARRTTIERYRSLILTSGSSHHKAMFTSSDLRPICQP